MLAVFRTGRRIMAGTIGLLVVSSWLSIAVAACITDTGSHAGMGGMAVQMHDCPHCADVEMPCADSAVDCELPAAIQPSKTDLPTVPGIVESQPLVPTRPAGPEALPDPTAAPPLIAGRDLHIRNCSFQE